MSHSRDENRFTAIYNTYVNEIYKFVFLRVGLDGAKAEDVTQEVFLDVYKGLDHFKLSSLLS